VLAQAFEHALGIRGIASTRRSPAEATPHRTAPASLRSAPRHRQRRCHRHQPSALVAKVPRESRCGGPLQRPHVHLYVQPVARYLRGRWRCISHLALSHLAHSHLALSHLVPSHATSSSIASEADSRRHCPHPYAVDPVCAIALPLCTPACASEYSECPAPPSQLSRLPTGCRSCATSCRASILPPRRPRQVSLHTHLPPAPAARARRLWPCAAAAAAQERRCPTAPL
jgi:hypothetical protein